MPLLNEHSDEPTIATPHEPRALPASTPRPASASLVLGWACALAIVTYLHRVGFSAIVPSLRGQLGLDDHAVGYFMAAFMVAYGAVRGAVGPAGRRARRPVGAGGRGRGRVADDGGGGDGRLAARPGADGPGLPDRPAVPVRGVPGGNVPRAGAGHGRLDARGRARRAQGAIWMASRVGGRARPPDPHPAVPAVPQLADAADPRRGPGPGLVRRVLALVPQHARGDAPGERRRAHAHRPGPQAEPVRGHTPSRGGGSSAARTRWRSVAMYGCIGYSGNFFLFMLSDYLEKKRHLDRRPACGSWPCRSSAVPSPACWAECCRTGSAGDGGAVAGAVGRGRGRPGARGGRDARDPVRDRRPPARGDAMPHIHRQRPGDGPVLGRRHRDRRPPRRDARRLDEHDRELRRGDARRSSRATSSPGAT